MGPQQIVGEQGSFGVAAGEIHEGLIDQQTHAALFAPRKQPEHIGARKVVAAGVVGVDEQQQGQVLVGEERHEVVGRIAEVCILRTEDDKVLLRLAVRIFLEGRIDDAQSSRCLLHHHLDELCGAVTRHYQVWCQSEELPGQQGIHVHPRGVLRQQIVEAGHQFLLQPGRWEIGVHQVVEVQHSGETPEAPEASGVGAPQVLAFGKKRLGDIQILDVVDFVPVEVSDWQRLQLRAVEEGQYAQHLFVVFVLAYGVHIHLQERYVLRPQEIAAELIDVNRLVILVALLVAEAALWHKTGNAEILVEANHGPIHPRAVLRHKGEVGPGIVQ